HHGAQESNVFECLCNNLLKEILVFLERFTKYVLDGLFQLRVLSSLRHVWSPERLLFVVRAACTASHSLIFRARLVENCLERRHCLRKQLWPGHAAGRAAAKQVRLKRREAVVAHLDGVGDRFRYPPLSLASQRAMLLSCDPVLDVEV